MVVYWDLVLMFNLLADYLLLWGAARLAGCFVQRRRLLLGALTGAVYAAVQLLFARSVLCLFIVLIALGAVSFSGTGRALKLTLLFLLLACALGGGVLLLGQLLGTAEPLARGVLFAELPWGVFFAAAVLSYLLLGVIFRNGAQRGADALARVTIFNGGRCVTLTLLRDTGNTLTDPLTGEGVPVVAERALRALFAPQEIAALPRLRYCSVGTAEGELPVFRCEELRCGKVSLGARLIAVSPDFCSDGGGYVGLWCEGGGANVQTAVE